MTRETINKILNNGIISLISGTIAISTISCIASLYKEEYYEPKIAYEQAEKPKDYTFEPYEHVFYRRYKLLDSYHSTQDIVNGQVEIPEGYEILAIENYTEVRGRGSQTNGFDVWFTNKETVIVEATYNEVSRQYEYSTPGKVVNSNEEVPKQIIKQ